MSGSYIHASCQFSDGVLDLVTRHEFVRIRAWPELTASRKLLGEDWAPFRPEFRLVRPDADTVSEGPRDDRAPGHAGTPDQEAAEWAARQKAQAYVRFRGTIPGRVAAAVEAFPGHQWNLLHLARLRPEFVELAESTPVLAWCLANCDQFRTVVLAAPAVAAAWQVGKRQVELLDWLGFPGTRAVVRLLRKIPPDVADPLDMRMLRTALLRDAGAATLLAHLPRITRDALWLACHGKCAGAASPKLLAEVAAGEGEQQQTPTVDLLLDSLEMLQSLGFAPSLPSFRDLRHVRKFHDDVLLYYQRMLEEEKDRPRGRNWFPAPPIRAIRGITPITSRADLIAEGRMQDNCVASYFDKVRSGTTYIYRVTKPERATLAIQRVDRGTWRCKELKRSGNLPVGRATRDYVTQWLNQSEHPQ